MKNFSFKLLGSWEVYRSVIKRLLKSSGSKGLIRSLHRARNDYYRFLNEAGKVLFLILKTIRILPFPEAFDVNNISRILIVRGDRIGDLVLSTPSLTALRNQFPDAHITLVVRSYTKDLVIDNPMVDKLVEFSTRMSPLQNIRFLLKLKKNQYDLAVVLHSSIWWCIVAYMTGAPIRIGYQEKGGGFLLTKPISPKKEHQIAHELERTLDVVRTIGADTSERFPCVSVTEQGERYADFFFDHNVFTRGDKIIAIHPGARQEYIRWRKDRFAAIANMIIERYSFKILLIGGKSEKRLIDDVYRQIIKKKFVGVATDMALTQLVSVIKRCDLFIGNSTGPMHIAAAVGVPVVAIFGCIHPQDSYKRWGPWGKNHLVISKELNCVDCHPSTCDSFDCLNLIEPHDVMTAVAEQVDKYLQPNCKCQMSYI